MYWLKELDSYLFSIYGKIIVYVYKEGEILKNNVHNKYQKNAFV